MRAQRSGARRAIGLAFLAMAAQLGCRSEGRPDNVVLILGDALRAGNLPTYGYEKRTAPFIDGLAERGLVFTNAYSHYSYTWPSISNLFTGAPYSRLVREGLFATPGSEGGGLTAENLTLAEILAAGGVRSRGVSANPWICDEYGFGQGFEALHGTDVWMPGSPREPRRKVTAEEVNEAAARQLDELVSGGAPWFLFLLYFDTHNPYGPPREDQARFAPDDYARIGRVHAGEPVQPDGTRLKFRTPPLREWFTDEDVRFLTSLYDGEIHHFDRRVQALFRELETRDLLDSTTVILSADHGEAFFERDYWGHGYLSREEEQHVPLIVVRPGDGFSRKVITTPVTTTDIFHSVLSHFRMETPPGRELVPWLVDVITGESHGSVAYSEGPGDTRILRGERYSLYRYLATEERQLPLAPRNGDFVFDRQANPGETHNLLEHDRDRGAAVRGELVRRALFWPPEEAGSALDPLELGDEALRERLRALGYVE